MNERLKNLVWIIVVIAVFTIFSVVRGGTSTYLDFGDSTLTVATPEKHTYTVNYEEINNIELVDEFDPGSMISGNETRKYQWGTWENEAWGEYTLCVSQKIDNALLITHSDNKLLVINYESEETTEALLELINDLLADRKTDK